MTSSMLMTSSDISNSSCSTRAWRLLQVTPLQCGARAAGVQAFASSMVDPSVLVGFDDRPELHADVFADVLQPVRDRRNGFDLRHRCLAESPVLPDPSVEVRAVVELGERYIDQSRKILPRRRGHSPALREKLLLLVALDDVPAQLESLAQGDLLLCS